MSNETNNNKDEKQQQVFDEVKQKIQNQLSTTKTKSKNSEKENEENITIPKAEFDSLNSKVNLLTQSLRQTKLALYNIQDALTVVQSTVLNTKNSI